ncbi:MAG: molybdopterin-dependent oxidoreductase [Ardenticatenaceae bacterium]|nr:molybdopterin-dependent oxidoreductase [Ardenticatenaceae bacterium]
MLVPTICFNCESACGLLAYVDKTTLEIKKFEGNPKHPGSRGRNCAKGPATHNQIYDPERILYPLKRVGARGEGKWKRITWDEAVSEISAKMRESRLKRKDGIMYHVGRPGEDHYTNRAIQAWGVDGHNSHTNICSAGARLGYYLWGAFDRPSPDHANARVILLISSHLKQATTSTRTPSASLRAKWMGPSSSPSTRASATPPASATSGCPPGPAANKPSCSPSPTTCCKPASTTKILCAVG